MIPLVRVANNLRLVVIALKGFPLKLFFNKPIKSIGPNGFEFQ